MNVSEPCPVAVSLGHDPALFAAATLPVPWGVSEYDFVGWLKGAPVPITRGPFTDLVASDVANAIAVSAFGGFLVAQQAVKRMLPNKHGAILFTGASASVKGYAQSAPFAMGKFALRGLAQSMARELSPQGIHVAHFVIDGGIRSATRLDPAEKPDSFLDPDAIALSYWSVLQQPRSAWTWELELRPWVEKF